MAYPKNSKEDIIEAINLSSGDIEQIAQLLNVTPRHAYRLFKKYDLVDQYRESKGDTENIIGDLTKDIIVESLLSMNRKVNQRIPLDRSEITLLIFLAKSKAGFVEQKDRDEDSDQDEDTVIIIPDNGRD